MLFLSVFENARFPSTLLTMYNQKIITRYSENKTYSYNLHLFDSQGKRVVFICLLAIFMCPLMNFLFGFFHLLLFIYLALDVILLFKYKGSSHGKVINALQPHNFLICFVCRLFFQFV